MAIPLFDANGLLPEGIYLCSLAEVRLRLGSFQATERRPLLMQKLETFVGEAQACGIVRALILDGSFVTQEPRPNDIDVVLVLAPGHDFHVDLTPAQYQVLNSRRVRRTYGLDVLVAEDGSADYVALVGLFQRVRLRPELKKGILRIEL